VQKWVVQMNWFKIMKIRPRKKKKIQPPNVFAGEKQESEPIRRVMGRGTAFEETPAGQRLKEEIEENKKKMPEAATRLGSSRAKEGEKRLRGNELFSATRQKATKTIPRNRCAMCSKMLSSRNRFTIDYGKSAKGKQIDLSFCRGCAERMQKK